MNPFGFSSIDMPATPLDELLALAQEAGYGGLELRSGPGEAISPDLEGYQRRRLALAFSRAGVAPLALAARLDVTAPGADGPLLAALRRHIWLTADLGARYLRVLPDVPADPDGRAPDGGGAAVAAGARARTERRLRAVASLAATCGVRILLEPHDARLGVREAAGMLGRISAPGVGALWDVQRTHRAGEAPADVFAHLAPHLGHIQITSVRVGDDPAPAHRRAATADDLGAAVRAAVVGGYDGWFVWTYDTPRSPQSPRPAQLLAAGRDWLEQLITQAGGATADTPRESPSCQERRSGQQAVVHR